MRREHDKMWHYALRYDPRIFATHRRTYNSNQNTDGHMTLMGIEMI